MNINEARAKVCPMAQNIPLSSSEDTDRLCVADRCMAWTPMIDYPKGVHLPGVASKIEGYCAMIPFND